MKLMCPILYDVVPIMGVSSLYRSKQKCPYTSSTSFLMNSCSLEPFVDCPLFLG